MAGKNSQWLGPQTRKKLFGSETMGTPRPGGSSSGEQRGYSRGALVDSKAAADKGRK